MKELIGAATTKVGVPIEKCFALLEAVERYPDWHPEVVREVDVVERDGEGRPSKARARLHVARGPVVRDFDLLMEVRAQRPQSVTLTRIRHGPSDHEQFGVRWHLREQDAGTGIRLGVEATLSVPRLVPVGGIGDAIAEGFVAAAAKELLRS
jgi:ribosome-associated toxin RatA of RatAB toxin-antitoxin module